MQPASARRLALASLALTTLISLPLVAGFFGGWHPALDSLGHFRLHLALLLMIAAVPLLVGRLWLHGVISVALAGAALLSALGMPIATGLRPVYAAVEPLPQTGGTHLLMQLNLRFDNQTPEKVLSLIGRLNPDVVTLNEVSARWMERLDTITAAYPHRIVCRASYAIGGVAILSRRPFVAGTQPECLDRGSFAIADVDFGGRPVTVATLHLDWPWPQRQAAHIGRISQRLAALPETAILAGDFNAAPWSAAVRRVAAAGGLTPTPPVGATWLHRKLPAALIGLGLPLDQVFVKGGIGVHGTARLEAVGSDHRPVLLEFSVAGPPVPADPVQTAEING